MVTSLVSRPKERTGRRARDRKSRCSEELGLRGKGRNGQWLEWEMGTKGLHLVSFFFSSPLTSAF